MSDWQTRISVNPEVMVGKPVIHGTRIPVELIVRMLEQGISQGEILDEYPQLQLEDIRACRLISETNESHAYQVN